MLKIIPTIAFLYCSCYAFSQTEEVNSIASFPHSVHDQAEILDMGQDFIELQEIQKDPDSFDFRPLENANTNLGFTDHHYWVKFTLNNESSIEKNAISGDGKAYH